MTKFSTYQIHTGPLAGTELVGYGCNAKKTPNATPDHLTGDGIWIPSLQCWIPAIDPNGSKSYTDQVTAFDRYNHQIQVGDVLHACIAKDIRRVRVTAFGNPYHQGCGWWTRILKVVDLDTSKTFNINNPSATIYVG